MSNLNPIAFNFWLVGVKSLILLLLLSAIAYTI